MSSSAVERRLKLARRPEEEGPDPTAYKEWIAPLAWCAFWILTGLDFILRQSANVCWRARWKFGVVMMDRHCPRCGLSSWRGANGCNCELVMRELVSDFELPPEAEVQDWGDRRRVRYHVRLRRDLFHWARGHEFFGTNAIDSLRQDDRLYREQREADRILHRKKR